MSCSYCCAENAKFKKCQKRAPFDLFEANLRHMVLKNTAGALPDTGTLTINVSDFYLG